MNLAHRSRKNQITVNLSDKVVKDAKSIFPDLDLNALAQVLLEKYVRYQKQKMLARQYNKYYKAYTEKDKTEERALLDDYAPLEAEINAFLEAEEQNDD
jgi:hypothetical protein